MGAGERMHEQQRNPVDRARHQPAVGRAPAVPCSKPPTIVASAITALYAQYPPLETPIRTPAIAPAIAGTTPPSAICAGRSRSRNNIGSYIWLLPRLSPRSSVSPAPTISGVGGVGAGLLPRVEPPHHVGLMSFRSGRFCSGGRKGGGKSAGDRVDRGRLQWPLLVDSLGERSAVNQEVPAHLGRAEQR